MRAKKQKQPKICSSFQANYNRQSDAEYPYLLAQSLHNSDEQFEQTRAMKMLGDWVEEYQKMTQPVRYKYSNYIPKILKILYNQYLARLPIDYCLSRFLLTFFQSWHEMTKAMVARLKESDRYTMELLWYTCYNLVEDLDFERQPLIITYLSSSFQEPLLIYQPSSSKQARKLLETVYLMNIQGCCAPFKERSRLWSKKLGLIYEASSGDLQLTILIDIIKNKNLLQTGEASRAFWMDKIGLFLEILELRGANLHVKDPLAREILDLFLWLLDIKDVREMLREQQDRYVVSLLRRTKPSRENPDHIFHDPKYREIRQTLYDIFFLTDTQSISTRLNSLLSDFVNHSYFVLNNEVNYTFLESLSERDIELSKTLLSDMIKLLGSSHVRRALSTKALIILTKVITASIGSTNLANQAVGQSLKVFNEAIRNKVSDPLVGELRQCVSSLFLRIMENYEWEDGFRNQSIVFFCEDFERNSKFANKEIFEILYLLVKKFGFSNESKIQPIINDLFYKSLTEEEHLQSLISLLVMLSNTMKFPRAPALIQELCSKNPSKYASLFLFQALVLARLRTASTADLDVIHEIITTPALWDPSRVDLNLMMIEVFFLKAQMPASKPLLLRIDEELAQLMKTKYEENNYMLLSLVAGKILGATCGQADFLESLQSYRWLREYSFEMLSRSFYKKTSINVCYIFSNIIIRSNKPAATIRWLSKDQFLDYLYQGLNDFISKQKTFTLQFATSILVYKLLLKEPSLVPSSSKLMNFTKLIKHVQWWDEADNKIEFTAISNCEGADKCTLPEFRAFYETNVGEFFSSYFKHYGQMKQRAELIESRAQEDDI